MSVNMQSKLNDLNKPKENKFRCNNSSNVKNHVPNICGVEAANAEISNKEKAKVKKYLLGKNVIPIVVAITGIVIITGTIVFLTCECSDNIITPTNSSTNEKIVRLPEFGSSLHFVYRSEWLAHSPNSDLTELELPSQRIIIAHTATENCTNQATCTFRVRYIQTFHMESKVWDDIGYNFLVGGDGAVYEGRGWDKEGAHTKGLNKGSICIAFIGTFNKMVPPQRQLFAAQLLINEGVQLKKLKQDYQLYGHRQLIPSDSPGSALYDIIKTWPHWSEKYFP